MGPEGCRAGTKRISNLIHGEKWEADLICDHFWQAGIQRVETLRTQGQRPFVIWDESVLEKPESLQAEGLCAVRSTKAVRLKRIVGGKGRPTLAHMRWWTTRGEQKSQKRIDERAVLTEIDRIWGKEVLHVWDRGFAGNP